MRALHGPVGHRCALGRGVAGPTLIGVFEGATETPDGFRVHHCTGDHVDNGDTSAVKACDVEEAAIFHGHEISVAVGRQVYQGLHAGSN